MGITYKDNVVKLHTFQITLRSGERKFIRAEKQDDIYDTYKASDIQDVQDLGSNKVHYRSV